MKIAFVHYHLKTGGVTTVLRQQIEAVHDSSQVLVLTGSPPEPAFPAPIAVVKGLGYDNPSRAAPPPEAVAESMIKAIHAHFGGTCHVLHVHNPTLAKNTHFLKILKLLQQEKLNFLLQIHDFAEDGRPQSYFNEAYISNCHYGVINSRDYDLLQKAGLKPEGLHRIYNTVKGFNFTSESPATNDRVLYPIRAIRRKNIGEAILLSLFFRNGETLAITQPPNSPADFPSYKGWKTFVDKHNLRVEFEAGVYNDFSELVQTCKFLITTSITEGFGFSYLEPWLANKLLWGRKLPDICLDFEKNGIQLQHLYTQLRVPLKWIDAQKLYAQWTACVEHNCKLFNYPLKKIDPQKAFATITTNGLIDFGLLNEYFQKNIISHVLSDSPAADELIRLNPVLTAPGTVPDSNQLILSNQAAVRRNYSRSLYQKTLLEAYQRVVHAKVKHKIDKQKLLAHFLDLTKFSLLKWCEYAG
jgi:hypothetical protein